MDAPLLERWSKASSLVIGCGYSPEERGFWEEVDPSYVGLGNRRNGDDTFPGDPFATDWDSDGYWHRPYTDGFDSSFERVYMDRCVWNCWRDADLLLDALDFIFRKLKPNGRLLIPSEDWSRAEKAYLVDMFRHHCPVSRDALLVDAMMCSSRFDMSAGTLRHGPTDFQVFFAKRAAPVSSPRCTLQ